MGRGGRKRIYNAQPGARFNRWTVLGEGQPKHYRVKGTSWTTAARRVRVRCDCGIEAELPPGDLVRGRSQQCVTCARLANAGPKNGGWTGAGRMPGKVIADVRGGAAARGIECTVSADYLWELFAAQGERCVLTGEPLWFAGERGAVRHLATASLDRIDSSVGYHPGNVQWVHKDVNIMKSDMTDDELVEWCRKIVKHADRKPKRKASEHPALFGGETPEGK